MVLLFFLRTRNKKKLNIVIKERKEEGNETSTTFVLEDSGRGAASVEKMALPTQRKEKMSHN